MAHTPHTWNNGDVVSAAILNALETDLAATDDAGAAAAAQAYAIQRGNHTGTQSADTITDGTANKAYTAGEQAKLAGVAAGATANRADSATDAAITAAITGVVNGAPGALDTLKELADALGDDANYAATITAALTGKATPADVDAKIAAQAASDSATQSALYGQYGYLVTTFLGNGASLEKLSVFYSPNGKAVVGGGINPVYSPTGGVRDPSALYIDGVWHVAFTQNEGTGTTFGVGHSTDLISWTLTTVDVSAVTGLTETWAPELVQDVNGDVYCFFVMNASSVVYVKATAADLTAWSAVSGLAWTVPPSNAIIDPTFAHDGTNWRMFYKNENTAVIERASSPQLNGTWTIDKTGDWAGWGSGVEGPAIINGGGTWRIYLDRYVAGTGYAYSESADLNTWTALTTVPSPAGVTLRHGCFVPILDSAQFSTAIGAAMAPSAPGGWTTPTWQNGYTGNLEYRVTKYGIQFRGYLHNSGTTAMASGGEVMFLIPELVAHHPTRDQQMICASDAGGTVRVQFGSGGDVAKFEVTGSVTNLFMPALINTD